MKQKYIPEIFTSPFCHLRYTLIRDLKECKHLGFKKKIISLNGGAAAANFITNDKGETLVVIYMPRCEIDVLFQRGLIVHEAVHIWQEIKMMMNEASPSIEFEAYSIQRISQDLMYLLDLSNDME
ncbi:MAG: hypothetical protein RRZ38_11845 [Hafnia sp.]